MKHFLAVVLAASAFAANRDEAAVRDLVANYADARERRDAKAVEALFTADADQLVSNGEWRRGLAEVVRGTAASSQANPGKRSIEIESVRLLARGVAIADGRYDLQGAAERHMRTTIVAVRTPRGWKIAAIRNMLPAK